MRRPGKSVVTNALLGLTVFLLILFLSLSLSPSPLSSYDPSDGLPDWIEDVYLKFDTLRTDPLDYEFPTDASHTMTSGFAEFRTMHFHAGIDLSTHGRTGYRVFASRTGYVSRISVSPYGYGRMLQVRHPDGFTTVYAHLSRFNDALEQYVRERQYQKEQYSIDEQFDEPTFAITKGDLIAYTGDTGVGPAHFHFEIRDERMNPVNPLLFPEFDKAITDSRYPEFRQINFIPCDFASRINGSSTPVVETVHQIGPHLYSIPRVVHLSGLVGLSVKATDQVDGTWHRNGVYHYELYLDSVLVFSSRLDRFSAKETEQIALHFDWPMVQAGEGRFQKLFLEPGNHLPLYDRSPERSGILQTPGYARGEHQLLIVAEDVKGNKAQCRATAVFDDPPPIEVRTLRDQLVLIPAAATDLHSVAVGTKQEGSRTWRTRTYAASTLAPTVDGYVLPVRPGKEIVKVLAVDTYGTRSYPVFVVPPILRSSNTSLSIKKEFIRDYLRVTVASHLPFTLRPSVWILSGDQKSLLELNAVDERTYDGTFPLSALQGGNVRLEASGDVNGTAVESFDEFPIFPITPEDGGTIVAGDGEFTIEFAPHGVYQPLYCRVEKTDGGYSVSPRDVLMDRGATVKFRAPDSTVAGLGLYYSGDGEFDLAAREARGGVFEAHIGQLLGEFSLRVDDKPPSIYRVRASGTKGRLHLSFHIRDNRSGVHPNRIRITVDDRLVIAPYDPYNHRVNYDGPMDLAAGFHELRIEAADRMGNKTVTQQRFRSR